MKYLIKRLNILIFILLALICCDYSEDIKPTFENKNCDQSKLIGSWMLMRVKPEKSSKYTEIGSFDNLSKKISIKFDKKFNRFLMSIEPYPFNFNSPMNFIEIKDSIIKLKQGLERNSLTLNTFKFFLSDNEDHLMIEDLKEGKFEIYKHIN